MNITVFGATGRTGRAVTAAARHRGHWITAHARAERGTVQADRLVTGSVFDPESADAAVSGADAVVIAFGLRGRAKTPLYTDGTRTVIEAMRRHGVPRLVVVSEAAYGRHVRGFTARAVSAVYRAVNRPVLRQRQEQDALVAASGLQWTFVRPVRLVEQSSGSGAVPAASPAPLGAPLRSASYARIGTLIVDELQAPSARHSDLYL